MEPRRLVWVSTEDPKDSGTGYLIGPGLVLTALHVVHPGRRWAEGVRAHVGHPAFGDVVRRRAEVRWPDPRLGNPPEGALDVALLTLDVPVPDTGDGPVRWGQPDGVDRVPFTGAGFPAFAADSGSEAHCEALNGTLSAVSTSTTGWVLDSEVWPAPGDGRKRPWAGASGSAIFLDDRLIGVVVEDNRAMAWRRLHAVPVHKALADREFAGLVTLHGHPGTTTELERLTAGGEREQIEIGPVPTLASAFQPRAGLRKQIEQARSGAGPVVLSQEASPKPTQILSGGGGVGKTQLAAAVAGDALQRGTDLVVWAAATEVQQVITQYARAAVRLRLPDVTGQDPEADARALLEWLATTRRRWLVVLDDVTDPAGINPWWPLSRTGTGRVLATTRLLDSRLTGGDRARVPIDVYSAEEADAYVRERLTGEDMTHLLDDQVPALTEALGRLPLALGLAAAHLVNEDLSCSAYLELFADRHTRLEEALPATSDAEGYGLAITTALLLSLDAARAADPTGLVLPVLRLISLLDPAGHPHPLWASEPVLAHLSLRKSPHEQTTSPARARSALRVLHRYALVTSDPGAGPRAVRIHALTARAVREEIPSTELAHLAYAAAGGLLSLWPEVDQPHPDLAAALRANTEILAALTGDHLWHHPERHPVLYRAGRSLYDAGMANAATAYWQHMADNAHRILGPRHPDALATRHNLAISHQQAGRTDEAIAIEEEVLAESERVLGPDHPQTLDTRHNLAASYRQAGRIREAITIEEQVLADRARVLGTDHPNTLDTRHNLATSYRQTGRVTEAITIERQVLTDSERVLGTEHPDTLTTRHNLAASYREAGRTDEAISLQEQVLADRERVLGPDHPDTLTTRDVLAGAYREAGRTDEAISLQEQVVADRERVLGPEHPDVLASWHNLALSYLRAGRAAAAVELLQRVLTDRERVLGTGHPDLVVIGSSLAHALGRAGRTDEAISLQEQVLTDSERVLGPDHPGTLNAGNNLANLYLRAGRTDTAIELLQRVLSDRERVLGPRHPGSLTTRSNLATAYQQGGRVAEAVDLQEQVLAERLRVLGPEHPDTLTTRHNLAVSHRRAGRVEEAVGLLDNVLAERLRVLGPDHPDTAATRDYLAATRRALEAGAMPSGRVRESPVMDPRRLVSVGSDDGGFGTGYLIGPQLVLTALHLVRQGGRWTGLVSTRVGHPRFGDVVRQPAQVCWPDPQHGVPPEDALDVALLWLDEPAPKTGEAPVRWGRPSGSARIPFTGAYFTDRLGDPVRVEDYHGDLSPLAMSSAGWVLDCAVGLAAAGGHGGDQRWAGASGSAVFCHGRLVGIAVQADHTDRRRLYAVPLHEALTLTGFADLVRRHGHPGTEAVWEKVTEELEIE
ncbi:FxSxx-COOH system tetratricopeptide repeat protein [Streptomyces griseus]|uniref:FxSxx-COOH system tetratricopeptide repeat protein n=1 Tax=Streptomyces griseus TaxID=1911 RepID=UPI0037A20B6D